jgi:hypothetical protein
VAIGTLDIRLGITSHHGSDGHQHGRIAEFAVCSDIGRAEYVHETVKVPDRCIPTIRRPFIKNHGLRSVILLDAEQFFGSDLNGLIP